MKNYPDFIESTGYGDVLGLCGVNCRHSFGPYIEGVSPETYSDDDLDEMASKMVTYKDWRTGEERTVPYYDATQIQRGIERNVRKWKRRQAVKEAGGEDSLFERRKVREWQQRAMDFANRTGLKRGYDRERVAQGGATR